MKPTTRAVIAEVAHEHGVTMEEFRAPGRRWRVAHPRQRAMFEAYTRCPLASLPRIGHVLGGRDHTTVLHGVRAHAARVGVDYVAARKALLDGQVQP